MNRLQRFITEIHRRSLWQVLLIYIGGAWVCYEIIDTITDRLALPPWLPVLAIILFLIGLPFVVATAFVREGAAPALTAAEESALPQSEADAATARHAARRRVRFLTWRNAGLSFIVALALWGVVATGWYLLGDRAQPEPVEAAAETRKSIAVLPLDNLSAEEANDPFTNGIHDDVLTHLSKIASLKVISRTSVMEYRGTARNIRQIAEELDVATVLEGGVQRAGDRVRINVQLIDARTDEHIWAETYDRELTAENIFAIQTDIAERIAAALKATLTVDEREQIEARPTDNLEAYEYYLRGNEYLRALGSVVAVEMYEQALELDPNFALAFAALSVAHLRLHFFLGFGGALSSARAALDEAMRLGPDLAETQMAQGYYHYYGSLDYDNALEQFRIVQRRQPNNVEVLAAIGWILRRQGKWGEAVANFERAVELDPRSEISVMGLGRTYQRMRRYEDAERYTNRLIALNPYNPGFYSRKARLYLRWEGSRERARDVLREASRRIDPEWILVESTILIRIFGEEYAAALERLTLGAPAVDTVDYFLAKADLYARTHQTQLARAYYDSARVVLEERVQEEPAAYGSVADELGVAYAGLGRTEEAIKAAKTAVDWFPLSKDAFRGATVLTALAEIYAIVGERDAAIDQLELLLSIPSPISVNLLRVDPLWDPVRDHPRFQKLLEDYQ